MNLGGTIRLNRTGICVLIGTFILLILYVTSNKKNSILSANVNDGHGVSLKQLLYVAVQAAERGGNEIRNLKDPLVIKSKGKTKEGVNDSVTNADIKSHCAMYSTLKQAFSEMKIVSEEEHKCEETDWKVDEDKNLFSQISDTTVSVSDITVWIDPLDATKEYTENKLQYVTTMVCVAVKGQPLIGVIHRPFSLKTSWAWVDNSHSEDLTKPADSGIDHPKFIISISHAGEVKEAIKKSFGDDTVIIEAAGAGYKSLEVSSGNVTVYYHTTSIKKWDICAGNAIIKALGGKMTTSYNDEIDYSNAGAGKIVNDKGLLATMYNHDLYVEKLNKLQ